VTKPTRRQRSRGNARAVAVLGSLLQLAFPSVAFAQAGALDPGFGGDGKVTTNFTRGDDGAVGLTIQSDQKLVAAGPVGRRGGRFGLARYNSDGTLDTSFGGDGKVATNFTSSFDAAFDVALQADGKLVAVGIAWGGRGRFALARYNTDGTLDTTFGGDGKVTTNFTPGLDFAFGVAIQSDQKIVVAGRVGRSGGRIGVARYNTDGSLDTTFSADGKKAVDFTPGDDRADLLAIQADGKIVAAGTANYLTRRARFALVRLDTEGTLDTSFGGDGRVRTNFTRNFDGAFSVAIQADQKIVAAGQAAKNVGVARYNSDGTLDTSFGGDGKVTTSFTRRFDYADDVEIEAGGKIVVAGGANIFRSDSRFALARYNSDGTLDTSFGGDGKLKTNFTPGRDIAFNVGVQADGNIVAAGRAAGSKGRFALARYFGA
jgi:uncharacterized delta-60 repeat protein